MRACDVITLDCETALIAPSLLAPPLTCTALRVRGVPLLLDHTKRAPVLGALQLVLQTPGEMLIGHNIAFDLGCIAQEYPEAVPLIFALYDAAKIGDTMIRQQLIDIAHGDQFWFHSGGAEKISYRLDQVGRRHGFEGKTDDTYRLRYGELRGLPISLWPLAAREYPLGDVELTEGVWYRQQASAHDLLEDEARQCRAAWALHLMSATGLTPCPIRVAKFEAKYRREYDELVAKLRPPISPGTKKAEAEAREAHWLAWVNGQRPAWAALRGALVKPDHLRRDGTLEPGSNNEANIRALIEANYQGSPPRTPPSKTHPQGQTMIDALTMRETQDPILHALARKGEVKHTLSNTVPLLRVPRIQSKYGLAASGRSTSKDDDDSALNGGNTQNFARKGGMRECIVPPPGYVFVSADFGKLELCTLGQVCIDLFGRSALADALNAGEDPHLSLAAQMLAIDYATAKQALKGLHPNIAKALIDNARQTGKVGNFGFPGGLGIEAFCSFALAQYDVRIKPYEPFEGRPAARVLKNIWHERWPEMHDYFDYINHVIKHGGRKLRHHRSNRWRGRLNFTDACNTLFQGKGADAAKAALYAVARACYADPSSPLYGCRIVNFVHDEIFLICRPERAHAAALELERIMIEQARLWLPDVSIEASPLLSECWSKDAEPLRHGGILIPWIRCEDREKDGKKKRVHFGRVDGEEREIAA